MCANGVSSIVTLPRETGCEGGFFYETLGLGSKIFPSTTHAIRTASLRLCRLPLLGQQIRRHPLSGASSVNLFVRDSLRQLGARFCHFHSQRPPIRA